MKWIWNNPLGLFGLLGLVILILIYILRPNFQQKFVSSTHIWKLSLKYRKKRAPIGKLRNILIIICQILIVLTSVFILTQPFIADAVEVHKLEKIIIIDASAGMLATQSDGHTRFENAILEARAVGQDTINRSGLVTLILAGKKASPLVTRSASRILFEEALDSLVCTFGHADIDGAVVLAEGILYENPNAGLVLFTCTDYVDAGDIEVVNLSKSEWNAAILDCRPVLIDNYYIFEVEIASYNREMDLVINLVIEGANATEENPIVAPITAQRKERCLENEVVLIKFDERVFLYEKAHVYIKSEDQAEDSMLNNDAFVYDNELRIYGGKKEMIEVLYDSSLQNGFFDGILMVLQNKLSDRWDIRITADKYNPQVKTGYDFYIFEHKMPEDLPTDGVVFVVNPDVSPKNSGLVLGALKETDNLDESFYLSRPAVSEDVDIKTRSIMTGVNASKIEVSKYVDITSHEDYDVLMTCNDDPVFLVKDTEKQKVIVLSFSLHYSTLAVLPEFPAMMFNIFEYFLPSTVTKHLFEVDENIALNARGKDLVINGAGLSENKRIDTVPYNFSSALPGTFDLSQLLLSNKISYESFYVKISKTQSDFCRVGKLRPLYVEPAPLVSLDLLLYLAIALVTFLFLERLLRIKTDI